MNLGSHPRRLAAALAVTGALCGAAQADTPADLLARYQAQSGAPGVPARGAKFFTTPHGRDWSCSTCHGSVPAATGRHASTGKPIEPLAPAFQARRFTDPAKVEKWFRRNCNDVAGRECTAGEKADVLSWLLTLRA